MFSLYVLEIYSRKVNHNFTPKLHDYQDPNKEHC